MVKPVDLPSFGRVTRLVCRKHRWWCPDLGCDRGSWTGEDSRIAAPRLGLTDRARHWVTYQVGRLGRTVSQVARELGCDWHTVNDTVIASDTALVDEPERIGQITALGLDETLFAPAGTLTNPAVGHLDRQCVSSRCRPAPRCGPGPQRHRAI